MQELVHGDLPLVHEARGACYKNDDVLAERISFQKIHQEIKLLGIKTKALHSSTANQSLMQRFKQSISPGGEGLRIKSEKQ